MVGLASTPQKLLNSQAITVSAGTQPSCSLWQRISVMQVMRQLCADAYFLLFLYTTYDAKEVRHVLYLILCRLLPFPFYQLTQLD